MAYTLSGPRSGTVRFTYLNGTITAEQHQLSGKVTSSPIEDGSNINDHMVLDPEKITITGVTIDGETSKSILEAMHKNRDLITYTGRVRLNNLAVTSLRFDPKYNNATGYGFSMTCQQVTITSAQYAPVGGYLKMSQQGGTKNSQTKPTVNVGMETTYTTTINTDTKYITDGKPKPSQGPSDRAGVGHNGLSRM